MPAVHSVAVGALNEDRIVTQTLSVDLAAHVVEANAAAD